MLRPPPDMVFWSPTLKSVSTGMRRIAKRTTEGTFRATSNDNSADGLQGVEVSQSRNKFADHDLREGISLGWTVESDEGDALLGVDRQLESGEVLHDFSGAGGVAVWIEPQEEEKEFGTSGSPECDD